MNQAVHLKARNIPGVYKSEKQRTSYQARLTWYQVPGTKLELTNFLRSPLKFAPNTIFLPRTLGAESKHRINFVCFRPPPRIHLRQRGRQLNVDPRCPHQRIEQVFHAAAEAARSERHVHPVRLKKKKIKKRTGAAGGGGGGGGGEG